MAGVAPGLEGSCSRPWCLQNCAYSESQQANSPGLSPLCTDQAAPTLGKAGTNAGAETRSSVPSTSCSLRRPHRLPRLLRPICGAVLPSSLAGDWAQAS